MVYELPPLTMEDGTPWYPSFIPAVKAIRNITGEGLRETLILMAETFSFDENSKHVPNKFRPHDGHDPALRGWRALREYLEREHISLAAVQGPHAITILKAIAARHGRLNVSTLRK